MRSDRALRMATVAAWMLVTAVGHAQPPPQAQTRPDGPRAAQPQGPPQPARERALLIVADLPESDVAPLRAAIERTSRRALLTPEEALALAEAAATGDAANAERVARVAERIQHARDAYIELRLDEAHATFDEAIDLLLALEDRPVQTTQVAQLVFERGAVALAARHNEDAQRDMLLAVILDPSLAPDPGRHGPPVLRMLASARTRRQRLRRLPLQIDRAPEDVVVRVDGLDVPPGQTATVLGQGRHLVVAEAIGFTPRALWVDVAGTTTRTAIVLPPASGAILASQAVAAWRAPDAASSPTAAIAQALIRQSLLARAVSAPFIVVARGTAAPGEVELELLRVETGDRVRAVTGARVDGEPHPYDVVAAALEGQILEPDAADGDTPAAARVTLTVAAPSRVEPGDPIQVTVGIDDAGGRVHRIEARCGGATARSGPIRERRGSLTLQLTAPDRPTSLACHVLARDANGAIVVQAPDPGRVLGVEVAPLEGAPWYTRWYLWTAVGVALAAGGLALVLAVTADDEPTQILRFEPTF